MSCPVLCCWFEVAFEVHGFTCSSNTDSYRVLEHVHMLATTVLQVHVHVYMSTYKSTYMYLLQQPERLKCPLSRSLSQSLPLLISLKYCTISPLHLPLLIPYLLHNHQWAFLQETDTYTHCKNSFVILCCGYESQVTMSIMHRVFCCGI